MCKTTYHIVRSLIDPWEMRLKLVIFKLTSRIDILSIYFEIALRWRPHWSLVNIGSGNGLIPSGNKLLPEPMLTKFYDVIWHHLATMT